MVLLKEEDIMSIKDNKDMNDKVTIKLFKDNKKYKEDVFVSVNGENFLIQRGVEVEVPRYIKEVLDNSFKQDIETSTLIETLAQP